MLVKGAPVEYGDMIAISSDNLDHFSDIIHKNFDLLDGFTTDHVK